MEQINLASGSSYFYTSEAVSESAIMAIRNHQTFYGDAEGLSSLRQAVVQRYAKLHQVKLNPDQVMITHGSKSALHILLQNLLTEPNDELLVPVPNWFGFKELMRYNNGKFKFLSTSILEDYALTPDVLERVVSPRTKAVIISNPCNPTGRVYSQQELDNIIKVLAQHPQLYLISDEIYDRVSFDVTVPTALQNQWMPERTIVVNGFSKSFAMSGWRVGYMIAPEELVKKCTDYQQAVLSGVSSINQTAALAALEHEEEVVAEMQPILEQNREKVVETLKILPALRYFLPQGAYYFFIDFAAYIGSSEKAAFKQPEEFWQYLKKEAGIEVKPGANFGAPTFARLSFAIEPEKLEQAMQQLQKALAAVRVV